MKKKLLMLLTACLFGALCLCGCGGQQEQTSLDSSETTTEESAATPATPLELTASYLIDKVPDLSAGESGGDWIVIALARSDVEVPAGLFDDYYQTIEDYVVECGGVLHDSKYTEYSRTALAVKALGRDPHNVGGYDLVSPLGDYDTTLRQGINGPIWALIALNALGEEAPANAEAATQATCAMYLQAILDAQLDDGGFALSGTTADSDITAMALNALSFYGDDATVVAAIDKAVTCLSTLQGSDGGFSSYGEGTCESNAQALTALSSLNIAADDQRFVKEGNTVYDALLTYGLEDGSFFHVASLGTADQMATEQAFYAMVAKDRMEKGLSSLFDLSK